MSTLCLEEAVEGSVFKNLSRKLAVERFGARLEIRRRVAVAPAPVPKDK